MREDFAFRGHDIPIKDDLTTLGREFQKRQIHTLAFAPSQSLPGITEDGEVVSYGLANYVRRTLSQFDVEVGTLSCYVNLIHPDLAMRQAALQRLSTYLQIAPAFGTHLVATETGSVNPDFDFTEDNFTRESFDTLLASIAGLLPIAHSAGTFLALEPGQNHPLYSLKRTQELIDYFNGDPAIKLVIDPANLVRHHSDDVRQILAQAFDRFGARIVAVHVKDFQWTPMAKQLIRPVVPGSGQVNVQDLVYLANDRQPFGIKCFDELPGGNLDRTLALPWVGQL